MKTLHFSITIQAPAEAVWQVLWDESTYGQWTAIFAEGSHAKSDWQEGSTIQFLDAMENGVYSRIEKKVTNRLMSFRNLGRLWYGREPVVDESLPAWSGALESYRLSEQHGFTSLWVEMEVDKGDASLFAAKFPVALQKVKELSEACGQQVPLYYQPAAYGLKIAV